MITSKQRLEKLRNMKDEDIDLSDIPELTDEQLSKMVPSRFYKPIKKNITLRLDADLLDVLKSSGKGYQTRVNSALRKVFMN